MEKLKFYSVEQFEHNEICRSHGYFRTLEAAMTKALTVVANVQDDIITMRDFCKNDNIPFDDYSEDMTRVDYPNFVANWEGGYNSVSIYELQTED